MVQETLLLSLLDSEPTIRVIAQNFWTEKASMPTSTIDRMLLILEKMYSPQTERDYLSYATNLLLERTSKSPDYNRLIYESPLSECIFREYNLTADWKRRHEMMTPLFVDTISSQNQLSLEPPTGTIGNNNNLRATQQGSMLQFQATQDINSTSKQPDAYNWLTQSSMDTLQSSLFSGTMTETQSALLFSSNRKSLPNASSNRSTRDVPTSNMPSNDIDRDIYRLRRRFVKDLSTTAQSRFFARKQVFF